MKSLSKIVILFVIIVFLHFSANALGIYDKQIEAGFVWFDNILHILTGVASALLWLWILKKIDFKYTFPIAVSILIFVFITALAWEIFEFGIFKLFTSQAVNLKLYSPSIQEALVDILSNVLGGVVIIFWIKSKITPTETRDGINI